MNNKEVKTVRLYLQLLDDPSQIPSAMLRGRNTLALLAMLVLGALWVFESNSVLTLGLAIGTSLLAGALGGAALCHSKSMQSWPILRPHISKESLKRRLGEIET